MSLEIRPLVKEDATEVAKLTVESFKNNPFRRIVFPNGMGPASETNIVRSQVEAVTDPDKYPIKVINTDSGEMAACAMWEHTKAMSEEDWKWSMEKAMEAYPDARMDLLGDFTKKSQNAKRRVMKDGRWWGKHSNTDRGSYKIG